MIILSAGHNRAGIYSYPHLKDTGALPSYNGYFFNPPLFNEHHECEKLVTQTGEIFKSYGYNIDIIPFSYNLKGKIKYVNKKYTEKDFLFEIHLNASTNKTAEGCEIWYYDEDVNCKDKACLGVKELSFTSNLKSRGVFGDKQNRHGRIGIIRDTKPIAYLFEVGFISNVEDMKKMRATGSQAIYDAIIKMI